MKLCKCLLNHLGLQSSDPVGARSGLGCCRSNLVLLGNELADFLSRAGRLLSLFERSFSRLLDCLVNLGLQLLLLGVRGCGQRLQLSETGMRGSLANWIDLGRHGLSGGLSGFLRFRDLLRTEEFFNLIRDQIVLLEAVFQRPISLL